MALQCGDGDGGCVVCARPVRHRRARALGGTHGRAPRHSGYSPGGLTAAGVAILSREELQPRWAGDGEDESGPHREGGGGGGRGVGSHTKGQASAGRQAGRRATTAGASSSSSCRCPRCPIRRCRPSLFLPPASFRRRRRPSEHALC